MGDWALRVVPMGLAVLPTGRWQRRQVARAVFFTLLSLTFWALSLGSLRSGLSPTTPDWLPYLGFGLAVIMLYNAGENVAKLLLRQRVVVDKHAQEVRSERALTGLVQWRLAFDEIHYILLSQDRAAPQGRRNSDAPMSISQEVWVHLYDGETFHLIGHTDAAEGLSWNWETVRERKPSEARYTLDLSEYDTPLHHAVTHIAHTLNVPVYIDLR
jgi:hypothetical protein